MPSAPRAEAPLTGASAQFPEDGIAVAPSTRLSLSRAAAYVAPASAVANLLGYAFNVVLSRDLGPSAYGELGALLGLGLIALVPALAVQPVVARALARAADDDVPALARGALRTGVLVGLASAAAVLALTPLVTVALHVPAWSVVLLALSLVPGPVVTAAQGVLQGRERFRALAAVFVVAAAARLVGGVAGAVLLGGVPGALAGTALGALVAGGFAAAAARPGAGRAPLPPDARRQLATASVALLGLLVLGNVDVLLARNRLSAAEAGLYAVGAVVAKAGFWAPQSVQVLVFARLAGDAPASVLRRSAALVAAVGAVLTGACAVAGDLVVRLAFGPDYAELGDAVWVFAATGSFLALAQLLLYARMAAADRRTGAAVAAIVALEVLVVVLVDASTPLQVALVALSGAVLLTAAAAALQRVSGAGAGA